MDEGVEHEWMNVPHFYYNFYVFQYATSLTASAALSEQVLKGGLEDRDRYLGLLKAGGSDYPVSLLRGAGVDMAGPGPFEEMMSKMNRLMDAIERILEGGIGNGRRSPGVASQQFPEEPVDPVDGSHGFEEHQHTVSVDHGHPGLLRLADRLVRR